MRRSNVVARLGRQRLPLTRRSSHRYGQSTAHGESGRRWIPPPRHDNGVQPRRLYSRGKEDGNGGNALRIGFASLANALPFSSPPETPEAPENGSHSAEALDPCAAIVLTALRHGVSRFDCPAPPLIERHAEPPAASADGATCWKQNRQSEVNISTALDRAWDAWSEENEDGEAEEGRTISVACKLGYRSAAVFSDEKATEDSEGTDRTGSSNTDFQEREGAFEGDARVGMLFPGGKSTEREAPALVHNLSREYVLHALRTSPLVQKYAAGGRDHGGKKMNVRLVSLAHNPETQITSYLLSNHRPPTNHSESTLLQRARAHMTQALTSAFVGYEIAVEEGLIDGYGVGEIDCRATKCIFLWSSLVGDTMQTPMD